MMDFAELLNRIDDIFPDLTSEVARQEFLEIREKVDWAQSHAKRPGCPPIPDNPSPGKCRHSLAGLNTLDEILAESQGWISEATTRWVDNSGELNAENAENS